MTGRNQSLVQVLFQSKPTMIGSNSNAHVLSFIHCPATQIDHHSFSHLRKLSCPKTCPVRLI
jgi:hypothetical protein